MATRSPAEAPTLMRGYVISEHADMKLGYFTRALRGIAMLTESRDRNPDLPEMPADDLAAIFYTLAEATESIRATGAFTLADVPVRKRDD